MGADEGTVAAAVPDRQAEWLPTIGFSRDASWDTVHSVLLGMARHLHSDDATWAMDVHFRDGKYVTAMWVVPADIEMVTLRPWNESIGDYDRAQEFSIPADHVARVIVL